LPFAAFVWFDGRVQRGRFLVTLVLVTATALVGTACGGSGDGGDPSGSGNGSRGERPPAREMPAALTGLAQTTAIRVDADNSADDGPFPTFDDEVGFGGYEDLVYRFGVYPAGASSVSGYGPDDYGTETTISAWFDSAAAPADAGFGVVCRLQDEGETYYRFGVGNDGTYSIALVEGDDTTILTGGGEWVTSDLIDTTSRSFIVEASCLGDELTLAVDNEVVDSVTDEYLISGSVGVFAKAFEEPDASIDLSVFDVVGYLEPEQVGSEVREAFDHMFGSAPEEIDRCDLGDVREMGLRIEPLLVASCNGVVYAYTDRPRDAARIYDEILDQIGTGVADELTTTERFPDCTRRTDVRGPFGLQSGDGEIACVEIGDETLVVWHHAGGFVGALRVPVEADEEFRAEWGDSFWPLDMQMKPG
jgi:hypothetical protein